MSQFHTDNQTFISVVELKVEDIKRSLSFYEQMLGLRIKTHVHNKVVFTADGKTPILSIVQPNQVLPKQQRTTGLYHFALLLPNRKELGKVLCHLLDSHYPLQGASHHGTSEAIYLADPDGNGIELYADTDSTTWHGSQGEIQFTTERLDVEALRQEGVGEHWDGIAPSTIVGHLHLHGAELDNMREFYHKALGFDIIVEIPNQAIFMSTGGYHHHIAVNVWNGLGAPIPPENSVGLKMFYVDFPTKQQWNKALNQLLDLGYEVKTMESSFEVTDPSGNRVRCNSV
ncbi:VOC family protein [Alkalihalobacterium bogoriense]|uniref:VOC family protein n=1 Tax=Alkalihalobacterium bogoriense TaxID=246272 RepID=UPI00047DDEDB|nr:VOC family protein [Alkalihalobacterium bogoriense]